MLNLIRHHRQPKQLIVGRPARGLTLVELMVVVVILVLLVGVVLPLAQPALKGREIREAARQVNAMLASARARAAATGRPVGIALIPQAGLTDRCYQLAFAKSPPPFSGDTGITARVDESQSNVLLFSDDGAGPQSGDTAQLLKKLVGDFFQIRFNYRGRLYNVTRASNTDPFRVLPDGAFFPPDATAGSKFQIYRAPVRSAATSIELPIGAYIDLDASGFEGSTASGMFWNNAASPIFVMFNPEGSVTEVYSNTSVPLTVNTNLFLLIANGKQSGPVNAGGTEVPMSTLSQAADFPNLHSVAGSLWQIVNHRTGTARTTDNFGPVTMQTSAIEDEVSYLLALNEARQFARAGADKGGR